MNRVYYTIRQKIIQQHYWKKKTQQQKQHKTQTQTKTAQKQHKNKNRREPQEPEESLLNLELWSHRTKLKYIDTIKLGDKR